MGVARGSVGGSSAGSTVRPRAWCAVGLATTLILAACSSGAGQVITVGGVSVLVSERTDAGMDALGGGTLEVVGDCLGTSGVVVVWPPGTRVVAEDPLTVEIPGQGTYALGEEVELGGGYVLEEGSGTAVAGPVEVAGVTVPAPCAEHEVFLAH